MGCVEDLISRLISASQSADDEKQQLPIYDAELFRSGSKMLMKPTLIHITCQKSLHSSIKSSRSSALPHLTVHHLLLSSLKLDFVITDFHQLANLLMTRLPMCLPTTSRTIIAHFTFEATLVLLALSIPPDASLLSAPRAIQPAGSRILAPGDDLRRPGGAGDTTHGENSFGGRVVTVDVPKVPDMAFPVALEHDRRFVHVACNLAARPGIEVGPGAGDIHPGVLLNAPDKQRLLPKPAGQPRSDGIERRCRHPIPAVAVEVRIHFERTPRIAPRSPGQFPLIGEVQVKGRPLDEGGEGPAEQHGAGLAFGEVADVAAQHAPRFREGEEGPRRHDEDGGYVAGEEQAPGAHGIGRKRHG